MMERERERGGGEGRRKEDNPGGWCQDQDQESKGTEKGGREGLYIG